MSAICGVVQFDGSSLDPSLLPRMTAAAACMGPDGDRHWVRGNAGLAHQAFHVTPESVRERQPLASGDGRLFLVSDARIDNRDELIQALKGEGLPTEPTDADLILAAYRRWRDACPERMLGDFAFAVWDTAEQRLFLARDALGGRGLCYHFDGRRCVFATCAAQILEVPGFHARLNEDKIADHLAGLDDTTAETLFQSVYDCPAAHSVSVSSRGVRKRRHWDVDPAARVRYADDREYADHFLELLTAATRCRMRAIGPIGLSLSGGLDSTLLAALASRLLRDATPGQTRLKCFSNVFDEFRGCDEREYIQPVTNHLNLDVTRLAADDKWTLKDLPTWPCERDYIWSDPYALLPAAVATAARDAGCRVLLDGQYGDVLFLGGCYWAADMMSEGRWRELGRSMRQHREWIRWRSDLLDHGVRQLLPARLKRLVHRMKPRPQLHRSASFHPDLAARVKRRVRADDGRSRKFAAPGQWVRLTALTDSSCTEGAGVSRRYYNRYGLEAESPYYDRRLVEFVMALPAEQLGRPWRKRWIQRNAMAEVLPVGVGERTTKTTFAPLMTAGLFQRETETVRRILTDARSVRRGFVRGDWLERALADPSFASDNCHQLWLIISLELWLRAQSDIA